MTTGPMRPADIIGNTVRVAEKNPAAVELGRKGGAARAKSMGQEHEP